MEDWVSQGFWWLPDDPDSKVAGTIEFDVRSGLRLQLVGAFGEHGDLADRADEDIILGVVPGKLVTLVECARFTSNMSFPGFHSEQYRAVYGIVGAHLERAEDLVFDRVEIELSHLGDFTTLTGITQVHEFANDEAKRTTAIKVSLAARTEPAVAQAADARIELGLSWRVGSPPHALEIAENPVLTTMRREPGPIDSLLKQDVTPLRNLVSLAVDSPVDLSAVRVSGPKMPRGPRDTHRMASLLFRPVLAPLAEGNSAKTIHPLFRLNDLDEIDFDHVVRRWLEIARDLEHTVDLFFGVAYISDLPLEARFLETIRALEVYHRVGHPRTAMPEEEFATKVERILKHTPDEDHDWLKGKLEWANEPSLNARIDDLLGVVGDALGPLVKPKSPFKRSVVDCRNFYTHYDPRLRKRALEGEALLRLIVVLRLMMRACFLHELGFSSERSATLLQTLPDYRWVASDD